MELIDQNPQSTVVWEYTPSKKRAEHYQSEAELEKEFIANLQKQWYEYLKNHKRRKIKRRRN